MLSFPYQCQMATVTVRTKDEGQASTTTITEATFRSWKRKHGRHTAFVVQMPGAENNDDGGVLVCTFADMKKLPAGDYQAVLVRKSAIPEAAKKELRGCDLWKCI